MAGQGAGPSRRSHTKSRTGCKTCKKRHIRCDETIPQCRNCTKHQVRCDYQDGMSMEAEARSSTDSLALPPTIPTAEQDIDMWQRTGNFPFPELQAFPSPQPHGYTRTELRLIHYISSVSRSLIVNGTSSMTVWTPHVPKYLSIAASYPYVMHALLAFSGSHYAWRYEYAEARKVQMQHGGIALRGLHDAINSFSPSNADAILAASILLIAQASDWRTWSSLESGIRTVTSAMEGYGIESVFASMFSVGPIRPSEEPRPLPNPQERHAIISGIINALQRLQPFLVGHSTEAQRTEELLVYVQTLLVSPPARTASEQFDQLYRLRKLALFVPSQLLEESSMTGTVTLVMAHFYATALALEPLYPSLGPSFCAAMSLEPLEHIIQVTAPMQMEQRFGQNALEIGALMQFPQQAAATYRSRMAWAQQQMDQLQLQRTPQQNQFSGSQQLDVGNMVFSNTGSLSPVFIATPITGQQAGSHSPYLELPAAGAYDNIASFTYGSADWGSAPSPAFPAQMCIKQEDEQIYPIQHGAPYGGFHSGSPQQFAGNGFQG